MDASAVLDSVANITFAVDKAYTLRYVSARIKALTGKESQQSLGYLCYKELMGHDNPCPGCPLPDKGGSLRHDVILASGERKFFQCDIQPAPDDLFIHSLTDITDLYRQNSEHIHQIKKLQALIVKSQLRSGAMKNHYDFLINIINKMSYGLMVADSSHRIIIVNSQLRQQIRENVKQDEAVYCYNIYGREEPCLDCPFVSKRTVKSPRIIGKSNVTVSFERYGEFLVESVQDTTRELQLINEIRSSQEELNEKQRQMEVLNRDLLRMNEELKVAQAQIDAELNEVGALQHSLLPEKLPDIAGYDFGAAYIPAEHAGGDYYDCIQMSNGYWGMGIADVSGHGAPAAVIMAIVRAVMRSYTYNIISPSEALAMVNEILCENVHTGDFVSMFYMMMDTLNHKVVYSSAGHNPVLHFDKSEMMVRTLTADGMFLATFPNLEFEERELNIDEGDILFMYTDGLVEAKNSRKEQYGIDRIISRIIMYSAVGCEQLVEEIMRDVKNFTDNHPFEDDVTILVAKRQDNIN